MPEEMGAERDGIANPEVEAAQNNRDNSGADHGQRELESVAFAVPGGDDEADRYRHQNQHADKRFYRSQLGRDKNRHRDKAGQHHQTPIARAEIIEPEKDDNDDIGNAGQGIHNKRQIGAEGMPGHAAEPGENGEDRQGVGNAAAFAPANQINQRQRAEQNRCHAGIGIYRLKRKAAERIQRRLTIDRQISAHI